MLEPVTGLGGPYHARRRVDRAIPPDPPSGPINLGGVDGNAARTGRAQCAKGAKLARTGEKAKLASPDSLFVTSGGCNNGWINRRARSYTRERANARVVGTCTFTSMRK